MTYIVNKINGNLYANMYTGNFLISEEDKKYFAKMAGWFDFPHIIVDGETIGAIAAKEFSKVIVPKFPLKVVPNIYVSGEIEETQRLEVPFVNKATFKRYLTKMPNVPNFTIPLALLPYCTGEEPEQGIQLDHPVGYYNGAKVSTFPYDLPCPMFGENFIVTMDRGIPGLFPLFDHSELTVRRGMKEFGYARLMTYLTLAEELNLPHYPLDENRAVAFVTSLMDCTEQGIYFLPENGIQEDPRGIGVNTNTMEILTCRK